MRPHLLSRLRKLVPAINGRGDLENRILQLGLMGGGLFIALVITLFYVQHSLDRSQRQLAELAVPAEVRIAQLESSLNAAFRRQSQIAATVSAAQLVPLRDRRLVEQRLREAGTPSASGSGISAGIAPDLSAHVERFLVADAAFFGNVEHRHALVATYNRNLADTDARVRKLVMAVRSLSGVLRLRWILQLREIAGSLDHRPLRMDAVRSVAVGPGRSARQSTIELLEAVMDIGWRVDDIDDTSVDQLTSLSANVLPQERAQIDRVLASLRVSLGADPEMQARVDSMAQQIKELLPQIEDETRPDSLISLRYGQLGEQARAVAIRAETEAAAQQLASDTELLHREVAALTVRSVNEASLTQLSTRAFSLVVAFAGLLGCLVAARRFQQGISELKEKNLSLTDLKENLTALNASLDARVTERTQALMDANSVLEKSRVQLAALDRVAGLGRLTAGLAHEVKTPIAATMNSLDSARNLLEELAKSIGHSGVTEDDLREISRELGESISRALQTTARVGQIIKGVREHTRGMNSTSSTEFLVLDRARAVAALVAHLLQSTQGKLDISSVSATAQVRGDVGKFDQILLNLVVNAFEAGASTGRSISVSIATAYEAAGVLVVSVQDDGPGFSPEARKRLFQPMYTTKANGTGLGLAISRELAEGAFGGSLELVPTPVGARFELHCGNAAPAQSQDAFAPITKSTGAWV